jgi:hypothetical protein
VPVTHEKDPRLLHSEAEGGARLHTSIRYYSKGSLVGGRLAVKATLVGCFRPPPPWMAVHLSWPTLEER